MSGYLQVARCAAVRPACEQTLIVLQGRNIQAQSGRFGRLRIDLVRQVTKKVSLGRSTGGGVTEIHRQTRILRACSAGMLLAIYQGLAGRLPVTSGCSGKSDVMNSAEPKVIHLRERDAEGALERLNRITGLRFARWPQSLVPLVRDAVVEAQACQPLAPDVRTVESA